MTALICVLAGVQVLIVVLGKGRAMALHDGALVLALTLCNQVSRVRYRQALPFSVFWLLLFALQTFLRGDHSLLVMGFSIAFATLLALMSLSAKRAMELDNRATFALKTLNAISADKLAKANQELEALARFDPLTGLPNRRHFDEYFERMLLNAQRGGEPLSMLFIDVDYFKRYNDHYGHFAGDECLCVVASMIRFAARRPLDLAARIGGEEFIVLLPKTDPSDAGHVAEELRRGIHLLNTPHQSSPLHSVTVSIGVTGGVPAINASAETYITNADAALYRAKEAGRNRVDFSSAPFA